MENATFDFLRDNSVEKDKEILNKIKKTEKKAPKTNDMISRINEIKRVVEDNLGKYKNDYKILITNEEIQAYFNKIYEKGICAIDTETTGLNFFKDKIVGISLYIEGEKACYIPLNHISNIYQSKLEGQADEEFVKEKIIEMNKKNIKMIYHNAKFDLNVLEIFLGYEMIEPYWDTLVGSYLINNDENKRGLKDQYNKYCNEDTEKENLLNHFNELFSGITFDRIPIESGFIYASRDAYMTYKLYEYQKKIFEQENNKELYKLFREIEIPIIKVTATMQRTGVAIDLELAEKLKIEYEEKLEKLTKQINEAIEEYSEQIIDYKLKHYNNKLENPINFNSTDQLAILLYDILGYRNENSRSTDEATLKGFNTYLTNMILEFRTVKKLLSTYILAIPAKVEESTKRLHASFNQNGTDTGRFSSSNPNLQNIPRDNGIRKMFKASDGMYLIGADYSQQEPRITASLCGDEHMIDSYVKGKDLYSSMASLVYKVPYEECREFRPDGTVNKEGKKRRSHIKAIFLGICYGKGVNSISKDLNITYDEAQKVYDSVMEGFPKFKAWSEKMLDEARKNGYTETVWGRRRYLKYIQKSNYEVDEESEKIFNPTFTGEDYISLNEDLIKSYIARMEKGNFISRKRIMEEAKEKHINIIDNSKYVAESERQVVNGIIQGSAADMTKRALVSLYKDEKLRKLGFRLLMSVHDENIGECPKENIKEVKERLVELMVQANNKCKVQMKCDVEVSECWYGESIEIN